MTEPHLRHILQRYLHEFWERRWLILSIAWGVCLAGWIVVALLPNQYTASARIYVDDSSILNSIFSSSVPLSDPNQLVNFQYRAILSRPNIERLIAQTDLDYVVADDERAREGLIADLQRRIRVSNESNTLFRMEFSDTNPQLAFRMVDAVVKLFRESNLDDVARGNAEAISFLDQQIASHERQLSEQERKRADFERANAVALAAARDVADRATRAVQEIRELNLALEAIALKKAQLQSALAATPTFLPGQGGFYVGGDDGGQSPQAARVAQLETELATALERLTPNHPDVRGLERQLEAARAAAAAAPRPAGGQGRFVGGGSGGPNPAYGAIQQQLGQIEIDELLTRRRLDEALEAERRSNTDLDRTPEVLLKYQQLNRGYEVLRAAYLELLNKRQAAELAQDLEQGTDRVQVRVYEPPIEPRIPSGPPRLLMSVGVLLLGVGLAGGVALLQVLLKDSFNSVQQIRDFAGLPVLGGVSLLTRLRSPRERMIETAGVAVIAAGLLIALGAFIVVGERLATFLAGGIA